jgi:hypothetical protein
LLSPTSAPTFQDRDACENSATFGYDGNVTRTCDAFVALKPRKRCKKVQPGTGKHLRFFCPRTCKSKCQNAPTASPTDRGECQNSVDFGYEGNATRTCDAYVALKPRKRCKKEQPGTGGKRLRYFCPATCKDRCKNTDAPTVTPTTSPTDRGECQNSVDFGYEGNVTRTCDAFVAVHPLKRCKKEQPGTGGKRVRYFCPATCKDRCKITDSPTHSAFPTSSPTSGPTESFKPSSVPSLDPSSSPSSSPSSAPSSSFYPSSAPSSAP